MSLRDRLGSVLALLQRDAAFRTVIAALDADFETFSTETRTVKDSLFIDTAEGQSLDLIGEELSSIAARRGRSDTEYRQFLQALVPAFSGSGTEQDVELAVSAGITVPPTAVDLREDFSGVREYEVELFDWNAHQTGTIRDLADLADPVAVDRIDPVYYFSELAAVGIKSQRTDIDDGRVLDIAIAGILGRSSQTVTINSDDSFGTARFDGTAQFS
jgi:hypothetical protein